MLVLRTLPTWVASRRPPEIDGKAFGWDSFLNKIITCNRIDLLNHSTQMYRTSLVHFLKWVWWSRQTSGCCLLRNLLSTLSWFAHMTLLNQELAYLETLRLIQMNRSERCHSFYITPFQSKRGRGCIWGIRFSFVYMKTRILFWLGTRLLYKITITISCICMFIWGTIQYNTVVQYHLTFMSNVQKVSKIVYKNM